LTVFAVPTWWVPHVPILHMGFLHPVAPLFSRACFCAASVFSIDDLICSAHTFEVPKKLARYYGERHFHFITFSCYRRLPYLGAWRARKGEMRERYRFLLIGYVVMPEHGRGLVTHPGDWIWSSWANYENKPGLVSIDFVA
jgi:hypothetical protein